MATDTLMEQVNELAGDADDLLADLGIEVDESVDSASEYMETIAAILDEQEFDEEAENALCAIYAQLESAIKPPVAPVAKKPFVKGSMAAAIRDKYAKKAISSPVGSPEQQNAAKLAKAGEKVARKAAGVEESEEVDESSFQAKLNHVKGALVKIGRERATHDELANKDSGEVAGAAKNPDAKAAMLKKKIKPAVQAVKA